MRWHAPGAGGGAIRGAGGGLRVASALRRNSHRHAGATRKRGGVTPGGIGSGPARYAPAVRLTRLTLKNWRNFRLANFPVLDRMVVVGPNASGKSNLLDALRFLRQVASPGGGFQAAVRDRGGLSRVRCLAARNYNGGQVTMRAEFGGDDGPSATYELTFGAEPRGRRRPILKRENVWVDGRERLSRPTDDDDSDPEQLTQTGLEQVTANRDFREVADLLRSIRYLHLVPHLIRDPERAGDRTDDPYGADFLHRIARTPEKTRASRLRRIGRAVKTAVPQFDQLELAADEIGKWHLNVRYGHWRPFGARHNESDFSDGTLRLIGLLWALLEGKKSEGPVLLEEPELSLHPSIVRQLPTMLSRIRFSGGPQVILTTHSSDLLEDEGLGKDEIVVLHPGQEGTEARLGSEIPDIQAMLDVGLSLADILEPATEPPEVQRLPSLFATR